MAGFGYSLKFWTLQQNNVSEKDITTHQYYGKETKNDGEYHDLKRDFIVNRGEIWLPRNKRPDKLRESIKIFEEALKSNEIVFIHWKDTVLIQVVFSNGLICGIHVSNANDILKISFDKSLIGKLVSPCSALLGAHFMCFSSDVQTKLTFSTSKPDTRLYEVDLPGPQVKLQRNLCMNSSEELMVCWWQFGQWLMNARDNERFNLVLLRSTFGRLEVLNAIETENDLIHVEFSKANSNQILSLEKSYSEDKESQLDSVVYECTKNKIHRLNVISFPLKSGVLSFARNSNEDKLVVGCSDGSVVLFDLTIQQTLATCKQQSIVPTIISWVGPLIMVGSGQGELKIFDSILNPILLFDMEEKEISALQLSDYLTSGNGLMKVLPASVNNIMLVFNGGPLTLLSLQGKITCLGIIEQHIRVDKVYEANTLLSSLNWNYECDEAYHGMTTIADWLLRKPLNYHREAQLEAALASFYKPKHKQSDSLVLKYRSTVGCYARRFFHHLLRYQRFEKALLLAKDINSSDLFLDIYFAAKDLGEMELAQVAKVKAEEIIATEEPDYGEPDIDMVALAKDHMENLLPPEDGDDTDYIAEALEKQFATMESSASTLKVTNLGYV